ncbi:MAG: alpha-galactosidase [Cyclobacteriaceae bacterium]
MKKSKSLNLFAFIILFSIILAGCSSESKLYSPETGDGMYILTPETPLIPQINGPNVYGVRPGSPFLYTIPATGEAPLSYLAKGLPEGLAIDEKSGVISGKINSTSKEDHIVQLVVKNDKGSAQKALKIKVGDEICLTPPLGWNSWNCWGHNVTQERVLASARAMVDKGLKDYGWTYVNVDDVWQGLRGGEFNGIQGNPETFPDIKQMCDQIHDMGLKVGIYSTPWITSYAGYIGSSSNYKDGYWDKTMTNKDSHSLKIGKYKFEDADAKQWAAWGIDYLKYDWYVNDLESTKRMGDALKNSGRDIVYSLSNSCPVHSSKRIGEIANVVRTSGDLKDRWNQEGSHLNIREQWILHKTWMEIGMSGSPSHFPDPDMLVVGHQSSGHKGAELRMTNLTADEQYSHISLWSLWSAPLLIGAPIELMDEFTVKLLTNSEVLAIQQDELATPATSVLASPGFEIFTKELADGSKAIGLFNLEDLEAVITLDWDVAELKGEKMLRDVWRQKDIGKYDGQFSAVVPAHGVLLLRAN